MASFKRLVNKLVKGKRGLYCKYSFMGKEINIISRQNIYAQIYELDVAKS